MAKPKPPTAAEELASIIGPEYLIEPAVTGGLRVSLRAKPQTVTEVYDRLAAVADTLYPEWDYRYKGGGMFAFLVVRKIIRK